jgi:hypothetical protein
MINIEEERKAFEIEWIKLGGDFKSFSIIDNMYVLIPSVASAGNVIKELAERAVNSAFALWLIQSRQKQVVIDDLNNLLEKSQATPEGFVLVPKELSDEKADDQAMFAWNFNLDLFKSDNRDMTAIQIEEFRLKWCLNKARTLQQDYKAMIEAQEQSHD